jgi:hypothetical protein
MGELREDFQRRIAQVCRYGSQRRDDVMRWSCRVFLSFYEAIAEVVEDESPDPTSGPQGPVGKR